MSKDYAQELYAMDLMDSEKMGPLFVTRVPGGWLMSHAAEGCNDVFVPWHNEFQPAHPTGRV